MRPAAQGRFPELKSVQSHATLARCLSSASETPRPYHACGNDGREVGRLVGVAARNVVKGLWNLARRRQSHLLGDDVQHRLLRSWAILQPAKRPEASQTSPPEAL